MNAAWKHLLICSTLALAAIFAAGCRDEGKDNPSGTSRRGDGANPTFDVRGGNTDSATGAGTRVPTEGTGGPGGSIRLTTSGGDIDVSRAALGTSALTPTLAGIGIDVGRGQTIRVGGAMVVEFLRVRRGGTLRLMDNTFFVVLGDVEIAGEINGTGKEDVIDGHDLTIDADGIVNIVGTINCSGTEGLDSFEADEAKAAGGDGGEIFISAAESSAISAGPHVFINGRVLSNGGNTYSANEFKSIPGHGGQILIGTLGSMTITGRISARGGFSHSHGFFGGRDAPGGQLQLIAAEGIEVGLVREINAKGGDTSGIDAGAGGSVLFEAPVGTITLDNFDIECEGGDNTYLENGSAGAGGTVTLSADILDIDEVTINTSGGDSLGLQEFERAEPDGIAGGIGGTAGTVQMAGVTSIDVSSTVALVAQGGQSNRLAIAGGDGGQIKVVNLDEADPTVVDFRGVATVKAGLNDVGAAGTDGTVCVRGTDDASSILLTGGNNFPISICGTVDLENFVVHDLDCDEGSINPDEVSTELPAVIGRDYFRVRVGTSSSVTISTEGVDGGNINLYAGSDGVLGSPFPGDYVFSSTNADSNESIEIDLTGFDPGEFVAVFVDEANTFVEAYTITVSCSE